MPLPMLQELTIRNFALVDELHLVFPHGLNLITGETGAGKSIVIDALGLALGARASGADVIRAGADRCVVEAVFDLADAPAETRAYLAGEELLDDSTDSSLIVTRELTRAGKNQCRINGRLMPVSSLRTATEGLVDIHGQHEHQTLLSPEKHLDLLDSWIGVDAITLRDTVAQRYAENASARRSLQALRDSAKERARNLDLYRFQQDEINSAGLVAGEEEAMAVERTRLANAEKLGAFAQEAYAAVSELALDGLNSAAAAAGRAAALDPAFEPAVALLDEAISSADEARRALRAYRDAAESDPQRLEEIEERLALLRSLKRKYGETVEEMVAYGVGLDEKLGEIENFDRREAELSLEMDRSEKALCNASATLSALRRRSGQRFAETLLGELRDLGMSQSRFEIAIDDQPVSPRGSDHVEFLISPNPGEPLKPLAKIASGGELSRVMLALKTVLSQSAYVPTLIFDEIDVGVGGRTALSIASKLAALSRNAQVFCITHLPQIASQAAAAHFSIEKHVEHGRTSVTITALDEEGRIGEIARMLGGTRQSQTVVQHARELLAGNGAVAAR
jgi:DNA repair protein RecN (Recombination protein N)